MGDQKSRVSRSSIGTASAGRSDVPGVDTAGSTGFVGGLVKLLALVLCGACGWLVIATPLATDVQLMFGAGVYVCAQLLNRVRKRDRFISLILMGVSLAVSTRYLVFRLGTTLPESGTLNLVFGGLLLMAELYAFAMLLFGYFQSAWPLNRKPVSLPTDSSAWPTVDVFVPTYNESLEVVGPTVLAARALDWPPDKLRVYILDDGCRSEFREFAEQVGVEYFERVESTHAKAGNINKALARTEGDFIAIFDCDHLPARTFLQATVGWLVSDPKMAMVQTPHHFYSPDPFERNLGTFRSQPNEGELFYGLIQRGNDLWNAAFFCGSCAIIRRTMLLEVGGIAVETVTEDAHTALRLHRRGYDTAYIDLPQAAGLATEKLAIHVGQRQRWARGMVQIFRLDNPLLGRGLSLGQRLCYAAGMMHFLHAVPRIIFLTAPLSYLFFDAQIIVGAPGLVLAYALPHLLHCTLTNSRIQGRFRFSFWSEVYEIALAPYIALPTTLALIAPKIGSFNVTAKGGRIESGYFDRKIALPHSILAVLNLAGVAVGVTQMVTGARHADVSAFNVGWCVYNLLMLGAAISVARESKQVREVPRVNATLPAAVRLPSGHQVRATTSDLSLSGAMVSLAQPRAVEIGSKLHLCLVEPLAHAIPATVVGATGNSLRLHFEALTTDANAALVEAVFSRGDAWLGWTKGRKRDRPVLEFLKIVGHGVRGVWTALSAPFRGGVAS